MMSIAYSISGWNRKRKWELFLDEVKPNQNTTVLDVGFSETESSDTENFLEKNYPYIKQITALTVDTQKEASSRYPNLKLVTYDGKIFPFEDKSFDVCWSNAVLEHVGSEKDQVLFLQEIKRVAKVAFITTPNKYFPVEVHTRTPLLHFLPKKIFDSYLKLIGKAWAAGDYMYLLSFQDIQKLLHAAGIHKYKIVKNKFLFLTLDFVIYIE